MNKGDTKVTITAEEYEELLDRDHRLTCLENSGVGDWEWYGEAMDMYREERQNDN